LAWASEQRDAPFLSLIFEIGGNLVHEIRIICNRGVIAAFADTKRRREIVYPTDALRINPVNAMVAYKTFRPLLAVVLLLAVVAVPAQAQEDDMKGEEKKMKKTIVEVAQNNDNLSILVKALKAADLVDTLQGEGPFTVFAPTNEAFKKLPDGKLESLMKEENKAELQSILKYHVVSVKAPASKVTKMKEAETLTGKMVKVRSGDKGVMLEGKNSAMVAKPDIMASNGVVHVIDTVLLPPEDQMMKKDQGQMKEEGGM